MFAKNRRARYDYFIEKTFEAGISLTGDEVKSIRNGQCSISEAYVIEKSGNLFLHNCSVQAYKFSMTPQEHQVYRDRQLLMHKREIRKLLGALKKPGYSMLPIGLYANKRGLVKIEIGLGKGKKEYDKRQSEKEQEWKKDKKEIMSAQR
jgi:SsrA-binding protein